MNRVVGVITDRDVGMSVLFSSKPLHELPAMLLWLDLYWAEIRTQ